MSTAAAAPLSTLSAALPTAGAAMSAPPAPSGAATSANSRKQRPRRSGGVAPAALPIIFVVSSEGPVLRALRSDLVRRFGNDTRIVAVDSPEAGLRSLARLADGAEPVALMIADHAMAEMTGVEFLKSAHALHPMAKRILLVERDYTSSNPIVSAMTLGQIDYHLVKPWFPERGLYPAVSEFLGELGGHGVRRLHAVSYRRQGEQLAGI